MSSSRTPPSVQASEEVSEVSELGVNGASVVTSPTHTALADIKSVWQFEKVEKLGGPDNASKTWRCGWCGSVLKGWNATKIMVHLARVPGNNDVKSCVGPIPPETLALYRGFRSRRVGGKTLKRKQEEAYKSSVSDNQKSLAVAWSASRSRNTASSGSAANRVIEIADGDDASEDVAVTNSAKLTTAIAEFVFCKGLSFSATEGEHFMRVLKLANLVPSSYRPPSRKVLANELLELSYKSRMERYMLDLTIDSDVYGLSLFGDGATVHGMPLMNILAAGVGEPCAVLSIVDCKFFVRSVSFCFVPFDSSVRFFFLVQ
jgi:hypothetical protein